MKKLDVYFQADGQTRALGELSENDRRICFEYTAEFLSEPFDLSPYTLPLKPGPQRHEDLEFGPFFGLFADSLLGFRFDGSPLDQLALLGSDCPGALSYNTPSEQADDSWRRKLYANPEDARIEYAYSRMATAAGIITAEVELLEASDGVYLRVHRADRSDGIRHHVHSLVGLTQRSCGDYELLLRVTRELCANERDVEAALRLMVFNILAHNYAEFAGDVFFRMHADGSWQLAPLSGLCFSPGRSVGATEAHIQQLGQGAGISEARTSRIIDDVSYSVADWRRYAAEAGVSDGRSRDIYSAFPQLPW
ncbi:MAG: hypothetical protein ACI8W8_000462 [Rhodothermales bacterium]|jgi:hypothetical protein